MQKKRHTFLWIGFTILTLIVMASIGYYAIDKSNGTLTQTAQDQLTTLKKGNLSRAYYLYTSDNYQNQTPLENFRQWVKNHPILTENESSEFFGENIRGNTATLSGELKNNQGALIPIIYRLTKEYGDWKIDSIQMLSGQKALLQDAKHRQTTDTHEDEHIVKVVQDHLLDLKYRNIRKAYENHLSEEFKKTVPYDDFAAIISENPELTEYDSIKFGEISEDEGLKRLKITLISDEDVQDVQFWLAKDRGGWKIWAIEVGGPTAAEYYELGENSDNQTTKQQSQAVKFKNAIQTIKSQLQDLKNDQLPKAYQDYVSKEFTKATSEEDFEKFIKNYPEFTEFKSIKIDKETENDGLLEVQVILTTDKGDSEVDYWLAKEGNEWKIWGMRVEESAFYPPISEEEKPELVQVIKEQLDALREDDVSKAYYAYVSQDFQNNTSFEDFQSFLKDYPILTSQDEVTIGHGIQEGDLRLIRIALQSPDETAEVDYRLIKQDGDWKIWGIQILTNVQDTPENEEEINQIILSQINALKADDLSKAYYAYTSRQFQEAASFNVFKQYVSRHDELGKNEKADIVDLSFKPTFVSAVVKLEDASGNDQTYLYRLIQENNQWKILSIRLVRDKSEIRKNQNPMEISKIEMGTEIDLNGLVTNKSQVFSTNDEEITVNVHIENGAPGDQVEAVLEHVKSNSSIPPVTAELDKTGQSVVNYVFTAPTQGWPPGLYRLRITSPSGANEIVEFQINK